MAHIRTRHGETQIRKALSYSPCVGILGMRQVGKSTLLKKFSKTYYSFDDDEFSAQFERQKKGILELSKYPLALDEIQKFPPAFDALKFSIDELKKPGRFLISGSVRFASRKQIRESLTGRITIFEMYPLALSECHAKPLSSFLRLLSSTSLAKLPSLLEKKTWATQNLLHYYSQTGGLPGICFKREPSIRSELFSNHLDTLLTRDIHLIRHFSLSPNKLRLLLKHLAEKQGLPTNVSELALIAGCSVPTAKSILEAMEGIFLVRPYGNTYFIEDSGLSHFLSPVVETLSRMDRTRLLHHELRCQINYGLRHEVSITPYTTRGGIDIPFLLEFKSGAKVAIIVEEEKIPTDKSLKSLTWAKKHFPSLQGLILTDSNEPVATSTGFMSLPWTWIF